jgi:hypothetical protein
MEDKLTVVKTAIDDRSNDMKEIDKQFRSVKKKTIRAASTEIRLASTI